MPAHALPEGTIRFHIRGYAFIKVVDHPEVGTGFVRRSHLIVFEKLGRRPSHNEVVHHINGNKTDDSPENLELMAAGEHSCYHRKTGQPWNKGKKGVYSEEHKQKIRNANAKRKWKSESKAKIATFAKERSNLNRSSNGRFSHGT